MATSRYTIATFGKRGVGLRRDELDGPAATEVLLRQTLTLVSPGTERRYARLALDGGPDHALGYCATGEVLAVGSGVDEPLRPGDRVIAMGWQMATHSNRAMVPQRLVRRIPDGLAPRHAILATIAATAIHAADRADLRPEDRVLVIGMGLVGMSLALVAARSGCRLHVHDLDRAMLAGLPFPDRADPLADPDRFKSAFTKIFLCIDARDYRDFARVLALLDPEGNGSTRAKLVNVGLVSGPLLLDPALGNVDIVNASRCGAGYRDDAFHHGLRDASHPRGEDRVDRNLDRALALIVQCSDVVDRLPQRVYDVAQALDIYNSPQFFGPGINLIRHDDELPDGLGRLEPEIA